MNFYQKYIHQSRYARYNPETQSRESWDQTVSRYVNFMQERSESLGFNWDESFKSEVYNSIFNLEVMPSMRALMTAGKALELHNVAGYNCSYLPIDSLRSFDEIMYILMNGTGVGFSVEKQDVSKIPPIADTFHPTETMIVVSDSKIGWASAFRELIALLHAGKIPRWDMSRIRPAGTPLKTFGGRASGPEPLKALFEFSKSLFLRAKGRQLTPLECHDLVCKIADIVVVGGVRRSALISLSNLDDNELRHAKSGQWWLTDVQRALANNSAVYTTNPDYGTFMEEWIALYRSKSGERGIFNRDAAVQQIKNSDRRDPNHAFGTNPCGEILLRPYQFCNLSEVIVRPNDDLESLKKKVTIATFLGTIQSTFTDFTYLRSIWKRNCEEERLLGVSLTGIMDNPVTSGVKSSETLTQWLQDLKKTAIDSNEYYSTKLGINKSAAITCIKPSGTVSQLAGCSSGIHPAYSRYYIRTVRADIKDPLCNVMKSAGVPCEPDVTKPNSVLVFNFPQKSPDTSVTRDEVTAIQQLELYLTYKKNWTEHNPSITVYVRDSEWADVCAWVWNHFSDIGGISFLPYSDHVYAQAPYQEITEEEYARYVEDFPTNLNWSIEEFQDNTSGSQELACTAGGCEL